ncbi:Uncharacterised protein [BD1-7 clade bacterium]|uniref:Sulfotransferase domain-containing protein n=1 Tax=BD1-7 clade bacterium TaxID=2029982 RepID=A0A5S9QTX5_9GAMM|nr:Uncharacterised protein [BD1-7 clade bacterium]
MTQLILHIGSHKTGTTSIQKALFSHRATLAACGWHLFTSGPSGEDRPYGNANPWIICDEDDMTQSYIHPDLSHALCRHQGNMLISSEFFSWISSPQIIQDFCQTIRGHFTGIKLIVYLRRQDLQAISHHQQGSKGNNVPASWFYGHSPRALPDHSDQLNYYLDYYQRMSIWADCLGDASVHIRCYERDRFLEQDVVKDFFTFLQLSNIQIDVSSETENISRGFIQTKLGHLMNQVELSEQQRNMINGQLEDRGKLMPSREEAKVFYQAYEESNQKLQQRFQCGSAASFFNDDFSMYTDSAEDLWDESKANDAIHKLLSVIKNMPLAEDDDIGLLLKQADALAKDNPQAAFQLKKLALTLRPDRFVSKRL